MFETGLRGRALAAGAARYYRELGYRVRITPRSLRVEGEIIGVVAVTARKRRNLKEGE